VDTDLEKLRPLGFAVGCREGKAVQTAYIGGQGFVSPEMVPRIRIDVRDEANGKPALLTTFDFSECEVAAAVGQPSLGVQILELTPESLDALDYFVATKKKEIGFPTRWIDMSDDPPG
jgi:hypothetical protein